MNSRQSKSFSGFTITFVALVSVAFGVLVWAGLEEQKVPPVDTIAQPQ